MLSTCLFCRAGSTMKQGDAGPVVRDSRVASQHLAMEACRGRKMKQHLEIEGRWADWKEGKGRGCNFK